MKRESAQWVVLCVFGVLVVVLGFFVVKQGMELKEIGGIKNPTGEPSQVNTGGSVTPTSTRLAIFDPAKNKAGDQIAGWRLDSVKPAVSSGPLSQMNVSAKFTGQATVEGTAKYESDDFAGDSRLCFTVTNASDLTKLPILIGEDDQEPGFCFSNLAKAKSALGFGSAYGQKQATITVSHYVLNYAEAEVTNEAELVSVK